MVECPPMFLNFWEIISYNHINIVYDYIISAITIMKLEITSKRIQAFYQSNPTINFEAVNLIFVELFEKLLTDMNQTMTNTVQSQLLSNMSENNQHIYEMKSSIGLLKDAVSSLNTDLTTNMIVKFMDIKKEYIEETKNIINTNTSDKIAPLLERNNLLLIDKTTTIVNDVVPKSQNQHFSQINDLLKTFQKTITDDTNSLLKTIDGNSIKDFMSKFEMKSSLLLQNVQQPIFSFISASEDRINSNIGILKDSTNLQQVNQTKIMSELGDIFNKFRTNHVNQQVCDRQLTQVLTKLYNSAEISNQVGFILLKRQRKSNILIENKDFEENVSVEDINRFMSNVEEQHCNGIFISQQSGISNKKNYQIEIHNNNVIVFIHNAEYSAAKIEVAVDIIDNISSKMRQFKPNSMDDCSIPKDILDSINNEYQIFVSQKAAVVEVFKESQKRVLTQIDEFRFPALDKFLSTKYSAPIQKAGLKCDLCKSFCGNNLKALAAHKRGCIRKNAVSPITVTNSLSSL